jgi:radical SAM superfamily enzyme YgiQ (UPF0313 family)
LRVLLVSANTEQTDILPLALGLNCVAVAARNAGHEVRFLDLLTERDTEQVLHGTIKSFDPEIIGISIRNIDDQVMAAPRFLLDRVRKTVKECRDASDVPIVLGGAGYSIFPESTLDYLEVDMGIQGEGEVAFPMLLDRMGKGSDLSGVPGLYMRGLGLRGERSFAGNLDLLPLSDPSLWSLSTPGKSEYWVPIQTKRGCSKGCSYCSTPVIEGRTVRRRRPERVIDEVARYVAAGYRMFHFVDNTFNIPMRHAKSVCRKIIESGLQPSWRCIFYPGIVDRELADLLGKAGCREVSLGFESGSERMLRSMRKTFSLDSIRRTSDMLRDAGIRRMGFLLLGGPGETKESVEQSLAFADSMDLDAVKVTVGIRIYPDTELAKTAVSDGTVSRDDNLLVPKFYVVREIETWMDETVKSWIDSRPDWRA